MGYDFSGEHGQRDNDYANININAEEAFGAWELADIELAGTDGDRFFE